MAHKIYLKVNTDLTASNQVLSWFEQLNEPPIPNSSIWWQCQTLVMEGFTNVVEHAHKDMPAETPIEIEAVRLNQSIEIRILAYGYPCNLDQQLQETPEFEDNEAERGRGLRIMSELADELSYDRLADKRMCLFIRKNY